MALRLLPPCISFVLAACGSDPAGPPVCVDGSAFRGEYLTIQAVTTGTPPRSVDPTAVRGALAVTVHVGAEMIPPGGAHVELWGAGRALATAPVSRADPPVTGVAGLVQIVAAFESTALPDGPQTLEVRLVAGGAPSAACPANAVIARLMLALVISNR